MKKIALFTRKPRNHATIFKYRTWPIKRAVFELYTLKAMIKGVFSRLYCCYGNLLCHENDNNVFTND